MGGYLLDCFITFLVIDIHTYIRTYVRSMGNAMGGQSTTGWVDGQNDIDCGGG